MFQLTIKSSLVIFSKFFSSNDVEAVLGAIPADTNKILFVDTGATPFLAATISHLVAEGASVHVRDHHLGEGRTPEAAEEIISALGDNAKIVARADAPGCASLVDVGEFANAVTIADPDLDGLVSAMKAAGAIYDGMESDAKVFDVRPDQSAETLTPLGWTACRALSTLPPYNPKRPDFSENAKAELYQLFVDASQGVEEALSELENRVQVYEEGVYISKSLLETSVSSPCDKVLLADVVGAARHDLSTLTKGMELPEVVVTVVKKEFGPIAAKHGLQYSLAVIKRHQAEVDLRDLVPEGQASNPEAGLLSNVSFLLHCNEAMFENTILPALDAKLNN